MLKLEKLGWSYSYEAEQKHTFALLQNTHGYEALTKTHILLSIYASL